MNILSLQPLPIHPSLVQPIYVGVIFMLCAFLFAKYYLSHDCSLLLTRKAPWGAVLLAIALIIWMGMRVASGRYFLDSSSYRFTYEVHTPSTFSDIDWNDEWFFSVISIWCKSMNFNYVEYFLVIEIGYIGLMLIAYWKVLWEDVWFAMLFAFSAFSFFSYGVNGLRNGLACSIILVVIALMTEKKVKNIPLSVGLCILAFGIHRTTMLPIVCLIASLYLVKNIKWAIFFWVISIVISLVAGEQVQSFFAGLGFDDRVDRYMTLDSYKQMNVRHGFRWDFLIYSSMPVILTWYIVLKRKIKDKAFQVIACTYILCNAFWVMVIRASFSNRFAYLSWFMYPLVIAYGVIRLHVWEDQDRKAGLILLAHAGFTAFMHFVYYAE